MIEILIVLAAASAGSWLSRACGKGKAPFGHGLEQVFYAAPYFFVLFPTMYFAAFSMMSVAITFLSMSILSYAGALLGKRTGHGQYIHLGKYRQPEEDDERLDILLMPFFGKDEGGDYWRCVAGLAVTGLAVSLAASISLAITGQFTAAALVTIGGLMKAPSYMIGHLTTNDISMATLRGEILTGVFGWGSVGIAYTTL